MLICGACCGLELGPDEGYGRFVADGVEKLIKVQVQFLLCEGCKGVTVPVLFHGYTTLLGCTVMVLGV